MAKNKRDKFQDNLDKLDEDGNLSIFLKATKKIPDKVFTGPSLYFHQRAIEQIGEGFLGARHLEMIYAVLPAWGMHNTGNHPVKVVPYEKFVSEINNLSASKEFEHLKGKTILSVGYEEIDKIVDLLFKIHVSESEAQIVSSSKTLHHILPNLIPPIDRRYSTRFMEWNWTTYGNVKDKSKRKEKEFERRLATEFITKMKSFIEKNETPMTGSLDSRFNTSLPKIFDNLIVVYVDNFFKKHSLLPVLLCGVPHAASRR